jgi:hypothetical protein
MFVGINDAALSILAPSHVYLCIAKDSVRHQGHADIQFALEFLVTERIVHSKSAAPSSVPTTNQNDGSLMDGNS